MNRLADDIAERRRAEYAIAAARRALHETRRVDSSTVRALVLGKAQALATDDDGRAAQLEEQLADARDRVIGMLRARPGRS